MNPHARTTGAVEDKAILGVLGGMGPLATAQFYQRIVEVTPSSLDQEHLPIVIWGDPTVPDRSAALTDPHAPSPSPWLLRGGHALQDIGAAVIAVPCNSAHPFLGALRKDLAVPILDIIDATVAEVAEHVDPGSAVAVLSTIGLRRIGTYDGALREAGLAPVAVAAETEQLVQGAIVAIKAGRLPEARRHFGKALEGLRSTPADVIVVGCTELTALRDDFVGDFPLIDSATMLARLSVHAIRTLDWQSEGSAHERGTCTTTRKAAQ